MRNETARNVEGCGMKNVGIEMRAWGALSNSERGVLE
jgi:hypothetical protein